MNNSLPDGFSFVYNDEIQVDEIIKLREKVGWESYDVDLWKRCVSESLITVGVSDGSDLVGVGFLAGNSRHAVLCDLVVEPVYQGKGLGKSLLVERLNFADKNHIRYLYTEISESNPMGNLYEELGFQNTNKGLFRQLS